MQCKMWWPRTRRHSMQCKIACSCVASPRAQEPALWNITLHFDAFCRYSTPRAIYVDYE